MPTFEMHRRGSTAGASSGRFRSWRAGDTIEAPDGEFDHLPDAMYTARVVDTAQDSPAPSAGAQARYTVEQSGGWTKVVDRKTGDKIGNSIRGTDDEALAEARARIDNLTS